MTEKLENPHRLTAGQLDIARMDEIRALLQKTAQQKCHTDDDKFEGMHNHLGGNVDAAYSHGLNDGETKLARQLLVSFFGYDKRSGSDWSEGR